MTAAQLVVILVDVTIVSLVTYKLITLTKKTVLFNIIKGGLLLIILYSIFQHLNLQIVNWIVSKLTPLGIIILTILFQTEIRTFLSKLGSHSLLKSSFSPTKPSSSHDYPEVISSILSLSKEKIGALIVIEQANPIDKFLTAGLPINATLTAPLLGTLFWPNAPTHDGAVIIKNKKIKKAKCVLPLSKSAFQDQDLGTRHHAAIGITEVSDALAIAISDKSGIISVAKNGVLTRNITQSDLETLFNTTNKNNKESV